MLFRSLTGTIAEEEHGFRDERFIEVPDAKAIVEHVDQALHDPRGPLLIGFVI
jgi:hypothetical protein